MAYNKIYRYPLSYMNSFGDNGYLMADETNLTALGGSAYGNSATDFSGNLYVADPVAHAIYKVEGDGTVTLFAGSPGVSGNNGANEVGLEDARFNTPKGVVVDKSGNIYVADSGNNQIRQIKQSTDTVALLAGDVAGAAAFVDGAAITTARFSGPLDVAVDISGNVFVADTLNHSLRLIKHGTVYTVAGNGASGDAIGLGSIARFNSPASLCANISGEIIIADTLNYKMKMFSGSSTTLFSGSGVYGDTLGNALTTQYHNLIDIDNDKTANVFVVDFDNVGSVSRLLRIDGHGNPFVVSDFAGAKDTNVKSVAVDYSGFLYVCFSDTF